jgi:hypothetical protein
MDRIPVDSSCLRSVGYDAAKATLEVEFVKGGIYRYFGLPAAEHAGLMQAPSKGQYFLARIRDLYRTKRIR